MTKSVVCIGVKKCRWAVVEQFHVQCEPDVNAAFSKKRAASQWGGVSRWELMEMAHRMTCHCKSLVHVWPLSLCDIPYEDIQSLFSVNWIEPNCLLPAFKTFQLDRQKKVSVSPYRSVMSPSLFPSPCLSPSHKSCVCLSDGFRPESPKVPESAQGWGSLSVGCFTCSYWFTVKLWRQSMFIFIMIWMHVRLKFWKIGKKKIDWLYFTFVECFLFHEMP